MASRKCVHIGPFKILEILVDGGMGIVYLAERSEPNRRRVAFKLVKLDMDTNQMIVFRFRYTKPETA